MRELTAWLEDLGLGKYAPLLVEHEVDLEALVELTDVDLKELGIPLGPRRKLLKAISSLASDSGVPAHRAARAPTTAADRRSLASEAERRQLTIMFCDLVGSTALSTRFDPEDLRDIITRYQECCTRVIKRFGGYVGRYFGDGMLIYFGYPQALEHDPERAIRAGLDIIKEVKELDLQPDLELEVRVGVATGEVVVGDLIGEGASEEQAVVGETPNLAARLQGLADPDTVVISDATRRIVGGLFDYHALGEIAVKGFSNPVRTWRVLGESVVESRFDATHGTVELASLVGRDEEIERLQQRWRLASNGAGQVVLLVGEPGIGKSRLALALREAITEEPHMLLRYFGSPHHESSALYSVANQLQRAARFNRDDSATTKLDKLEALLAQSELNAPDAAALFASLLSIPSGDRYPPLNLTAQRQKDRTLDALEDQLLGLARQRPVLVIFEDLHWVDPTTRELLDRMVDRVQTHRVLLMMTYRPDFSSPWSDYAHATTLTLSRLGRIDNERLIAGLTQGKALPAEVLDRILAHSDGVPLFVEELTKTVLDGGYLEDEGDHYAMTGLLPEVAIPETLHDSLMARLDRFAPVREVAQTGAVIGRQFTYELLAAVISLDERGLLEALDQLVEAQLVFRRGTPPEATYTFKHALVQDAAYASLLRSKRRALHARIANVLERSFPEVVETEPELLAHHFRGAQMTKSSISYLHRAAQRAIRRSALVEALEHLRRAHAQLVELPEGDDRDRQELALRNTLGPTLLVTKGYAAPEVQETFARARELGERVGDLPDRVLALRGLWAFSFVRAEYQTARELSQELLDLAASEGDTAHALEAHRAMGMTLLYEGLFEKALDHLQRGSALYDAERHRDHAFRYGNDPGVVCLIYGAQALWMLGHPAKALERMNEGLECARALAHPFTHAQALALATMHYQHRREAAATRELAEHSSALSAKQGGFPYWSSLVDVMRGWALSEEGDPVTAMAEVRKAMAAYEATGALIIRPWFLGLLAEASAKAGQIEDALKLVDDARSEANRSGEGYYQAELERLHGELVLIRGADEAEGEAEASFLTSLQRARDQGARSWQLRAAISLGRLWRDRRQREQARALLGPILDTYEEGKDTADVRDAVRLLETLD